MRDKVESCPCRREGRLKPVEIRIGDPVLRILWVGRMLEDDQADRLISSRRDSDQFRPTFRRREPHRTDMPNNALLSTRGKAKVQPSVQIGMPPGQRNARLKGLILKLQIKDPHRRPLRPNTDPDGLPNDRDSVFPFPYIQGHDFCAVGSPLGF